MLSIIVARALLMFVMVWLRVVLLEWMRSGVTPNKPHKKSAHAARMLWVNTTHGKFLYCWSYWLDGLWIGVIIHVSGWSWKLLVLWTVIAPLHSSIQARMKMNCSWEMLQGQQKYSCSLITMIPAGYHELCSATCTFPLTFTVNGATGTCGGMAANIPPTQFGRNRLMQ